MPFKSRKTALVAAVGFFLLMIGIGSIPNEANQLSAIVPDKVLHALAYGSLAALIYVGQPAKKPYRGLVVLLAIAVMGGLDEAIQSLFTYRTSSLADWMCDMLSALVVVAALSRIKAKRVYVPRQF